MNWWSWKLIDFMFSCIVHDMKEMKCQMKVWKIDWFCTKIWINDCYSSEALTHQIKEVIPRSLTWVVECWYHLRTIFICFCSGPFPRTFFCITYGKYKMLIAYIFVVNLLYFAESCDVKWRLQSIRHETRVESGMLSPFVWVWSCLSDSPPLYSTLWFRWLRSLEAHPYK